MAVKNITHLENLIGQGRIEEVVTEILEGDISLTPELKNTFSTLSGQLSLLKKERNIDTLSEREYRSEMARITFAVLETLKFIKNDRANQCAEKKKIELVSTEKEFRELLKKKLDEDYEIEEILSEGEDKYSIVYKVKKNSIPKVLKVFKTLSLIDEENDRLVQNDLNNICAITHKNPFLVTVEYDRKDFKWPPRMLQSEFVAGDNLDVLIKRRSFSFQEVRSIMKKILSAVDAFHKVPLTENPSQSIAHGNLVPSNILIEEQTGTLIPRLFPPKIIQGIYYKKICSKLLDFFKYCSPEQIDHDECTPKSDQYSLGVIIYELFTGKQLFEGNNIPEVIQRRISIVQNPSIVEEELDKVDCPKGMISIVQKMLQQAPENRYANLSIIVKTMKNL